MVTSSNATELRPGHADLNFCVSAGLINTIVLVGKLKICEFGVEEKFKVGEVGILVPKFMSST
jgi:hypothetical protein